MYFGNTEERCQLLLGKHGLTAVLGTNTAFPRGTGSRASRAVRQSSLHRGWRTTALEFNLTPGLVRSARLNALFCQFIRFQLLKPRCFSGYMSRQVISAVSLGAGQPAEDSPARTHPPYRSCRRSCWLGQRGSEAHTRADDSGSGAAGPGRAGSRAEAVLLRPRRPALPCPAQDIPALRAPACGSREGAAPSRSASMSARCCAGQVGSGARGARQVCGAGGGHCRARRWGPARGLRGRGGERGPG